MLVRALLALALHPFSLPLRSTVTTCTPWEPACLEGWSVTSSGAQPWPGRGIPSATPWGAAWGTPEPGLCQCPWAAVWPAFCSAASSLLGLGCSSVRSPSSLVSPAVGPVPNLWDCQALRPPRNPPLAPYLPITHETSQAAGPQDHLNAPPFPDCLCLSCMSPLVRSDVEPV